MEVCKRPAVRPTRVSSGDQQFVVWIHSSPKQCCHSPGGQLEPAANLKLISHTEGKVGGRRCELITNGHRNSTQSRSCACCACVKHAGALQLSVDYRCAKMQIGFLLMLKSTMQMFYLKSAHLLCLRSAGMCTSSRDGVFFSGSCFHSTRIKENLAYLLCCSVFLPVNEGTQYWNL